MTQEQLNAFIENPKAFLSRGKQAKKSIEVKEQRIEHWRRFAEDITVTLKQDGGISGKGYKQSRIEIATASIDELERELVEDMAALAIVEKEIRQAINELLENSAHKQVLEMRYLSHLTVEEIAVRLNYAFRWVQRLNSQALAFMKETALGRGGVA